jgi:hypothetical protein
MASNSRLVTDAFRSALRAPHRAAQPERYAAFDAPWIPCAMTAIGQERTYERSKSNCLTDSALAGFVLVPSGCVRPPERHCVPVLR